MAHPRRLHAVTQEQSRRPSFEAPASSKANLRIIAVLQELARSHIIPQHRNYLLTSYEDDGTFIPVAHNERPESWREAFPKAEARRSILFPDGLLDTYQPPIDETALAESRAHQEQLLLMPLQSRPILTIIE